MKKLKKLTLKKETIVNLNDSEMNDLRGGTIYISLINPCRNSYAGGAYCPSTYQPSPGGGGHTKPPRCCAYGCCETIGC
ncbi:class I lanthipeptide [Dysgonomonas sp. Marseille-P4677]|uniref:class I lanthipeptide n=1 Tax=Dysgonomonas sp. Marseille-P4677 TaxID=2364790 RepID=UPI00191233C0|nr:class I lanthipeptide [Dysgonomonas sp. Marseille-P4677]MBK5722832.1 class I lanthipeptide [Dysgonomonas sp. Marseille-P4677]